MKIKDILAQGKPTLSFEVFPPKVQDNYDSVETAVLKIAGLKPSFMSVTYGAEAEPADIRWTLRPASRPRASTRWLT